MKRTVKVVILGAMLQGSAHADEQSVTAKPSLGKEPGKSAVVVRQTPEMGKKSRAARKKSKPDDSAKAGEPASPTAQEKQDKVTETPAETQTVQLRGVRG